MLIFHQGHVANHNTNRLARAEEHLANGRLVTVQQYGFDGASRITNKFTAPKMHPASFTTFSGTYDADNRLNGFAADTDGNLLAMPGVPEGNAASAPGALGATWDARNRLTTLTGAAGWRPAFSASYAYDSEGNRISKTVGVGGVNSTTAWTVNPNGPGGLSQVLVETVNGGAKKFFVHGPTGLLYDVDSAATPNVRHYHTDQVGSTVALTNASGAVIGRAEYSAYGMVSYREGDTATPFLYNGAYGVMTDAESGLLNMRARYGHPWMGRFVSADPLGLAAGTNLYAYCGGDPIDRVDPDGQLWFLVGGLIGAGLDYAYQVRQNYKAGMTGGNAWTNVNGKSIILSGIGGAVSGGVGGAVSRTSLSFAGKALANGVANAAVSGATQVAKNAAGVNGEIGRSNLLSGVPEAVAWGAATGAGGSLIGDGIEAVGGGVASFFRSAVWNSGSLTSRQFAAGGAMRLVTPTSPSHYMEQFFVAFGGAISNSVSNTPVNPLTINFYFPGGEIPYTYSNLGSATKCKN